MTVRDHPDFPGAYRYLAAALGQLGAVLTRHVPHCSRRSPSPMRALISMSIQGSRGSDLRITSTCWKACAKQAGGADPAARHSLRTGAVTLARVLLGSHTAGNTSPSGERSPSCPTPGLPADPTVRAAFGGDPRCFQRPGADRRAADRVYETAGFKGAIYPVNPNRARCRG